MRPALLASALVMLALPAMAQPARMSRPLAAPGVAMAQGCMADCLSGTSLRHGAAADAQRICQVRCTAAARFNNAPTPARGRPGAPLLLVAAAMPAPPGAPHSVIYAGRSPSPGFGLVAGERDRLAAFRLAEEQCRVNGTACRLLMEAPAACGAVAQALRRSPHALVMTADPSTYIVTITAGGFGPTQAAAEAEAMSECRSRDQGGQCRVMAARCGARS